MPVKDVSYEQELLFARDMVKEAGLIAQQYYRQTDLEVITKSDKTPVTIADETINALFIDMIKDRFPEHGVLGEERSWNNHRSLLWVCDPIDNTSLYTIGSPLFMISVALVANGKPVVAVTGDPAAGDIFWASAGSGAFKNGNHIRVSTRKLKDSRLVFPPNRKTLLEDRLIYDNLDEKVCQTTIFSGSVFKGMRIAEGLLDAAIWPRGSFHSWDVAAVKLIVEEAGGKFTDANNHEQRFDAELTGGMIISNRVIHDELLSIIKA